jgi:precorrin-3B C17-methyltransferase
VEHESVYVENLSTSREWITHDLSSAAGRDNYFALALVRRKRETPTRSASEAEPAPLLALRTHKITLIGIGPGSSGLLTGDARQALHSADDVVGYEGYLKHLEPLALRARLHGSPIGAETERAALALKLAGEGRRVAVISSGDAGVYGMASLLLERAEELPHVEVQVIPGITAALSAAALLGAPLGHDFACISLSDLLTPWEVIERRLAAAGQGDFVVALYNPLSQRRTWQLPRAREILLQYRRPGTPVGLVTAAYRPNMCVRLTTLGELTNDGVDMETTLIVGSSQTRIVNGQMVTPRGYGERS